MSAESPSHGINHLGSPKSASPSSPPSGPSGGVELPLQQANELSASCAGGGFGGNDGPNGAGNVGGPGSGPVVSGGQSPPHNYRHSRAYRHFKNPPQPHMCIRVTTVAGEELFINVLSWTRIVIPQEPSDPIPLYGGMKVPPGSPRCPPLVYAVMANPEVLKDSGRHSKDPEGIYFQERRAMVELMCDFVEAMNPDVKLTRNAVILKDRDISGELKDVWNAVQAQRDREREEQMPQHHYTAPPPQQMFLPQPGSPTNSNQQHLAAQNNTAQADNPVLYMEFGPESALSCQKVPQSTPQQINQPAKTQQIESKPLDNDYQQTQQPSAALSAGMAIQSAINNSGNLNNTSLNENDNKQSTFAGERSAVGADNDEEMNASSNSVKPANDVTDSIKSTSNPEQTKSINLANSLNSLSTKQRTPLLNSNQMTTPIQQQNVVQQATAAATTPTQTSVATATVTATSNTPSNNTSASNTPQQTATATITTTTTTAATTTATTTTVSVPTPKKEKLAGFLPNGCHNIFPRFKNSKHKDKDKDKEKDKDKDKDLSKSSTKEKTLLNSFKKSSSTASANALNNKQQHHNQHHQQDDNTKSQYDKNCLSLEADIEKLDLNKLDTPSNDMLIKLKVASSGAK